MRIDKHWSKGALILHVTSYLGEIEPKRVNIQKRNFIRFNGTF